MDKTLSKPVILNKLRGWPGDTWHGCVYELSFYGSDL